MSFGRRVRFGPRVAIGLAALLFALAAPAFADPVPPPPPPPAWPMTRGAAPAQPLPPPPSTPAPTTVRGMPGGPPPAGAVPRVPTARPPLATPLATGGTGPAPDTRARPPEPPPPGWAVPDWDLDWRNRASGLGPPLPPPDPFEPRHIRYRPDTTVVSLDARRKALRRIPQWVDVIDRTDLVEWRPLDIGDLARWCPNVMIADGGNPSLQMPFVRGLGRDRVKILTDGVWPATQALGFHGGTLTLWDPEVTERVEIYHGPGAYLKSIDSPGGMINIIPRRPRRHGRLSADTAFAASYYSATQKRRGRAEADVGQDRVAALVGATWTAVDDRDTAAGKLVPSSYRQLSTDLAADYFLDNRSRIGVTAQFAKNYDVASPSSTTSDITDPNFERLFLAITLASFDVGSVFGGTRASISIDSFFQEEDQAFVGQNSGLGTTDDVKRYDFHLEGNLHIHPCHETWSELTISYARMERSETILSDGDFCGGQGGEPCNVGVVREYEAEEWLLSWLVEDQYHDDCWDLYGGVRVDWYHLDDNQTGRKDDDFLFGASAGVCRHFSPRITGFANASIGWRRPSIYERTSTSILNGATIFGNPDLEPELHANLELGTKANLKDRASFQAAVFGHYMDDFIGFFDLQTAGDVKELRNFGEVFQYGGEVEAAWRPFTTIEGAEFFATAGATLSTDHSLVWDVPLLYRGGLRYSVVAPRGYRYRRWFAEVSAHGATNSQQGRLGDGPYTTVDFLFGLGIDHGNFRRTDIGFGVTNILDANYVPPASVLPAAGISFLANLGLKF